MIDDTKKTKHKRKTDQPNNEFHNTKQYSTLPVNYILVTLRQVFILFANILKVVIDLYGNFCFVLYELKVAVEVVFSYSILKYSLK